MRDDTRWRWFVSAQGNHVVERELRELRLSAHEAGRLDAVMARIDEDAVRHSDLDHLADGIWELRVRLDHRILRLLYSHESHGTLLLALIVAVKKTQTTPRNWIATARSRRAEWRCMQPAKE